jgi:hypothetical protein
MKKILLISATLMLAHAAFSQGTINFGNRAGSSSTQAPGRVAAPVYGVNPADPTRRITGNTSTGIPAGTQTYTGVPFLANDATHTFQATLWALNGAVTGDASANNLQQVVVNGTAPFSATTSGLLAGIWTQPSSAAPIPGAALDTDRPTFQVRVWDTKGGTITTWAAAQAAWLQGQIALGYSDLFTVPYSLGQTLVPPNNAPNMQGLQSFNVTVVPEPSVIALGILGAGCLFMLRRRK